MSNQKRSVVLVSVDALKTEFVLEQARLGVQLPNINRYFVQGGMVASGGVESVFPTFTYPCHQSIITGVRPAVHGIFNNAVFDPMGVHNGAWHWFATNKVQTLWEAASRSGYLSASVAFPTSVGARGDYIAPEFWWDGTALDSAFIDAVAKPQGLVAEMESAIGQYPGGLDLTEEGDSRRHKATLWMLQHKLAPQLEDKPFFLSAYFASFDETAHIHGVYSREAAQSLQKIDTMLGELVEKVREATGGHCVICVVSDHGTLDNRYNICPNVLLREAGLIDADEHGRVTGWRAWSQRAGGISEIRLRNSGDADARALLGQVVDKLAGDPESGILEVLTSRQAAERGGFPLAEYVLVAHKGFEIRDDCVGAYRREQVTQKAQHGYSEQFPEMRASFLITGEGIECGRSLQSLRLIDIAPTLAHIMGFDLPDAEGANIL